MEIATPHLARSTNDEAAVTEVVRLCVEIPVVELELATGGWGSNDAKRKVICDQIKARALACIHDGEA